MGTVAICDSTLQNKLMRLCQNHGWSYAVLWSFGHRNSSIVGQKSPCSMKHRWIFSDHDDGSMNHATLDIENIEFQTVALIGLETVGLQLGSIKKIYETTKFVEQAKRFLKEMEASNVFSPTEDETFSSSNSLICNSEPFHKENLVDLADENEELVTKRRGNVLRHVEKRNKRRPKCKINDAGLMERISELRKLIPNGRKMNIDSLLVQTVEHILSLESATKNGSGLMS